MNIPITPLIDLSNGILCSICAWKLHISSRKDPTNQVIRYFATAYFFLIFAYAAFSLPRLLMPADSRAIGVGFLTAHIFLFLATGYFVMVTTFFFKAGWHRVFFWVFLLLSLAVMVVGGLRPTLPVYYPDTGITNWNIDLLFGTLTSILFLVVLIPSSLFFFYQGIRTRDRIIRIRSIWIAFGLALLLIAAATYYTAATVTMSLLSDLFSLSAFLSIFIGVYYKRVPTPVRAGTP